MSSGSGKASSAPRDGELQALAEAGQTQKLHGHQLPLEPGTAVFSHFSSAKSSVLTCYEAG